MPMMTHVPYHGGNERMHHIPVLQVWDIHPTESAVPSHTSTDMGVAILLDHVFRAPAIPSGRCKEQRVLK
jgi:hypothetical protein